MTRPVLLQAVRLLPALERQLAQHYEIHHLPAEGAERDALLQTRGADFVGLVTSAMRGADAALIDALSNLRVISCFGVGIEKIDLKAAAARGIPVGYTPDVLNDCVADMGFGLLVALARRLSEADRYVRGGNWRSAPAMSFPLGRQVSGARMGVVGRRRRRNPLKRCSPKWSRCWDRRTTLPDRRGSTTASSCFHAPVVVLVDTTAIVAADAARD